MSNEHDVVEKAESVTREKAIAEIRQVWPDFTFEVDTESAVAKMTIDGQKRELVLTARNASALLANCHSQAHSYVERVKRDGGEQDAP